MRQAVIRWVPLYLILSFALLASAEVKITIGHNTPQNANTDFHFSEVPPPSSKDAAADAKLAIVVGGPDGNSGGLAALTDGHLPTMPDEPSANFFFEQGEPGGRFLIDLGHNIDIAQVNTYSWHTDTRAPQLYNLYVSDGSGADFELHPDEHTDPATRGWKLLAAVDTRPKSGVMGGQYGVSISDSSGSLGQYRYLLFDCAETEARDDFGNTFYSEVDVVEVKK